MRADVLLSDTQHSVLEGQGTVAPVFVVPVPARPLAHIIGVRGGAPHAHLGRSLVNSVVCSVEALLRAEIALGDSDEFVFNVYEWRANTS